MYYSGIGSRSTPENILHMMGDVAYRLANKGWILRSGGADGADNAFEQGLLRLLKMIKTIESQQIFILLGPDQMDDLLGSLNRLLDYDIAERFIPAWKYLKRGASSTCSQCPSGPRP